MPVYTVTQIAQYLRQLVDSDDLLADLYITGEVSNASASAAGHHYFTIKDADSQLRCVMFKGGVGGEHLQQGASVTIHGRMGFYQVRGELQLYVDMVQPEGVGELHMKFLRLQTKLEAEGLFEQSRKRPLPAFPKRIAVVTSRTGSVWHDIQQVIARRYPLVELLLAHSPVQGDQAPPGVVAALEAVNRAPDIDVVILARGGGSLEELWAFNEETVARAIYASRVPVVSAIGHETDTTIADFVADVRAPTPSAAAEIVAPDRRDLHQRIAEVALALTGAVHYQVRDLRDQVQVAAHRLDRLAPDVTVLRQRVDELSRAAGALLERELALRREQVGSRSLQLEALRPENTLNRGYALVTLEDGGGLVSEVGQVGPGDFIGVRVSDGSFKGRVEGASGVSRPSDHSKGKPKKKADEQMPLFG
ncbi:MAG: exodeoxyribonuclease VII large subunit [Chloroflexi bacterium]|nr:exodeoxyribonuclease VII large subunit [Chloroflexota bacterium]